MKAFITGSRAYGTAMPTSDFDLVIQVSVEDKAALEAEFGTTVRAGNLNLICLTTEKEMMAWMLAKEECMTLARPFDGNREGAVAIHEAWFRKLGLPARSAFGLSGEPR